MMRLAQKQNTRWNFLPGQSKGLNLIDGLGEMDPLDCIYTYNLIPSEFGLRLRKGYREWATGLTGEVRTLLPFDGSQNDNSQDRLFAATEDGIFDVSLDGTTTPTKAFDWPVKTGRAGYGVFIHYTDASGAAFMLYADYENGLHQYEEATGLWTLSPDPTSTGDTPPAAGDVVFIMSHKQRVWFVGRNEADVWYFNPGNMAGDATRFTLGGKLKHGGNTVGMWNWTIDGGDGVDDYMVFISRAGDVVVYRGIDPETTGGWDQVGAWFLGELPNSSRVASEYSGELYILCAQGVIALGDLVRNPKNYIEASPSYRISRVIRDWVERYRQEPQWQLVMQPGDNFMQIVLPAAANNGVYIQPTMDLTRKAWGYWRGVPIICAASWRGEYFMGDTGRVLVSDGSLDGTEIAGSLGTNIEFSILTSYQVADAPATYKRVQFIRPKGITDGDTSAEVRAIYDFDIDPSVPNPAPLPIRAEDTWDVGQWDNAVWSGRRPSVLSPRGGRNMGIHIALAARGETSQRITLIGWDVAWDSGGFL